MADMVYMKHPEVEGLSEPTTREAFEKVWSRKGWYEAEHVITITDETGRPQVVEVDETSSKADLEDLAVAAGVDLTGAKSKAEILDRISPPAPTETPA